MSWFSRQYRKARHAIVKAGDKAKHAVVKTGDTIIDAGEKAGDTIVDTGKKAGDTIVDSSNAFRNGIVEAGKYLEKGAEETGKGIVAASKYISSQVCSIGVGASLTSAFLALNAEGEEEATMTGLTIAIATAEAAGKEFVEVVAVQTAVAALSISLASAVWIIPGVDHTFSSMERLADFIGCVVNEALDEAELIIATDGAYLEGLLIGVLTSAICDGRMPSGCNIN